MGLEQINLRKMQNKRIFNVSKVRLVWIMCSNIMAIVFGGCICFLILITSIKASPYISSVAEAYGMDGIMFLVVSAIVQMLFLLLFGFVLSICVFGFIRRCHLFSLSINISYEGIEIVNNKGKYFLPVSDIMYIFPYKSVSLELVWELNDNPTTFSIEEDLFTSKDFKEIIELLRMFRQYTDDKKQIRQICNNFKLNNYFRMNRLEYKLGKLSKEQV